MNFDDNTSFFAVYDGHGGAEVAQYCADKLPEFLKSLETYKGGNLEQALKDAFLGFDKTLLDPAVVHTLKILAGEHNSAEDDAEVYEEEDDENLAELHEESNLPLNEVLEKYKGLPQTHDLAQLKKDSDANKLGSTSIRGRRAAAVAAEAVNKAVMDPSAKPAGSSTSAAAVAAAAAAINEIDGPGPSCSRSSKLEPEDESTVSSSSSSTASKNTSNLKDGYVTSKSSGSVSKVTNVAPTEQNGNVTSSEAKAIVVSGNEKATTSEDATVSGSSDIADAKSNGNLVKTVSKKADATDISSTSKEAEKAINKAVAAQDDDSTDDDADYDESDLIKAQEIAEAASSSDEDMEEDTDGHDDEDDDDDDDEDDEVSYNQHLTFIHSFI